MKFKSSRPNPLKLNKKYLEACWQNLLKNGGSNHSRHGSVCAEFLNRCVKENRSFTLYHLGGGGYLLKLGTEDDLKKQEKT